MCMLPGYGAESQSDTMWPGGRGLYLRDKFHFDPPYHVATIHQRYRQTDRAGQDTLRSDSIGRTVLQTVAQKWMRLCFEKPYWVSVGLLLTKIKWRFITNLLYSIKTASRIGLCVTSHFRSASPWTPDHGLCPWNPQGGTTPRPPLWQWVPLLQTTVVC